MQLQNVCVRWLAGIFAYAMVVIGAGQTSTNLFDGRRINAEEPEHMYTNALIGETSPYLLQHAHNPVNWYPWGKEAFEKAKRENKPVFLSVGYSTCYWCHVMEVESFEDPEVAAVINQHFVAIKVDREERPDLDEQYMLATQLMTTRGGWPNSVWLKPDGKPWMAGTYFPKQRFISVLRQVNEFWINRRADVDRQAEALANAAKQNSRPPADASVELTMELVQQASDRLISQFDPRNGGFGGAPKFPPHGTLALLIERYRTTKEKSLLEPISKTLDAMWLGGMHDHLGGGFHRYATDANWLLPHFEKMLYDNAQLIQAYAGGYDITGHERYRAAVADTYRWVKREMTSPQGAFYSALDSGEVGKEGEAYIWSVDQVRGLLGDSDAALYTELYNFTEEGNFAEESTGERTGKNIPHLKRPIDVIAENHELGAQVLVSRLAEIQEKLLADRLTWPQPHKDDKVLTSWNGLMITALAHAGRVLNEPEYVDAAAAAANFILDQMVQDGRLLRSYRSGTAKLPGYLDDYVYFSNGLLELYLATEDPRWLDQAAGFADIMIDEFEDETDGGFFFTGDHHEALMARSKHLGGGGNMPNPNGVAAQVLIRLGELTGKDNYRDAASRTLRSVSAMMAQRPHTSEDLLIATRRLLAAGRPDSETKSGAGNLSTSTDGPGQMKRVEPITLRASVANDSLRRGQDTVVTVSMDIDEGWHLYAENPQAEFLIPTAISISSDAPISVGEVVAPKPESRTDPILKQVIDTYTGKVSFQVPVRIGDDAAPGATKLRVVVRSQACDESRCLQPQTTNLEIEIRIVDAR
jgi:uncharacterized protein YyaL (SSP411 family)